MLSIFGVSILFCILSKYSVVPVINDIGRYFVNCTLFDFVSVVDDFKVTIKIRRLENMIRKLWFIENMIRKVRGKVGIKEKSLGTRLGISLWNFRAFVKEFLPAEWSPGLVTWPFCGQITRFWLFYFLFGLEKNVWPFGSILAFLSSDRNFHYF
jgi:hypothetical protein